MRLGRPSRRVSCSASPQRRRARSPGTIRFHPSSSDSSAMSRARVLLQKVPDYRERKRAIESELVPANIGALLYAACEAAKEKLAIAFFESDEYLTYDQLRQQVNRLANGMIAAGIVKGTHVGVMISNVAAFPITWLALARAGAVAVP